MKQNKINEVNLRVEICGGIAAGKTSLSYLISETRKTVINESFESNPFIESFYKNAAYFSFETEVTFALQHYHDIKKAARKNSLIICDFSVFLDLAYADVTLNKSEHKAFTSVHNEIVTQIGHPDILIYLKCDPLILRKRIVARNREFEQGVTVEYLNQLISALENRIFKLDNLKIIVIDSGKINFIENHKQYTFDKIQKYLNCLSNGMNVDQITYI